MIENNSLQDYFDALERLKKNVPIHVPMHSKITRDAVSLEAQRGKGSIKKSRTVYTNLIKAIDFAALEQSKSKVYRQEQVERIKLESRSLRQQLDSALSREVSLLNELFETRKKLYKLTGEKIVPIRKTSGKIND
jgi:hypothetical protein